MGAKAEGRSDEAMTTYVALLYSIVLTPQRRVVMSDLRAMASSLGLDNPRTLASTGNLVFEAAATPVPILESRLESAFAARFGRQVDILVRKAPAWRETVAANPFAEEAALDARRVGLRIMREPLDTGTIETLEPYRTPPERLAIVGGDLWICFDGPPNESRLLGALTTKRLGIGTLRNWNTVRGVAELLN